MGWNRVKLILACVLVLANFLMLGLLFAQARASDYIPDEAMERLVSILEKDGISLSENALITKKQSLVIYGGDIGDTYHAAVARALSGSEVSLSFTAPGGVTYTMENGDRCAFGGGFNLRYEKANWSEKLATIGFSDMDPIRADALSALAAVSPRNLSRVEESVERFLSGVRGGLASLLSYDLRFDGQLCGYDAESNLYYYVCSQNIRGTALTNMRTVFAVFDGEVVGVKGEWCFSDMDTTYSAQLYDQVNILYRVKDRIKADSDSERIVVSSLSLVYAVHYHVDGNRFYLIPAWRATTDDGASYLLNAVNGAIYTD